MMGTSTPVRAAGGQTAGVYGDDQGRGGTVDEHGTRTDGATPDAGDVAGGAAAAGAPVDAPGTDAEALPPSVQALEEAVGLRGVDATQHAQELLAEHVPLALLVDLLTPTGDTSSDLLAAEGLPAEEWWQDEDAPADGEEPGTTP